MLVNLAIRFVYAFMSGVLSAFELLPLPSGVSSVVASGVSYILQGFRVVAAYTHFSYLLSLFVAVAAVDMAIFMYKCIMWFLKKIPFWGVK